MMTPPWKLMPVATLALATCWLSLEVGGIVRLERECEMLGERIAAAEEREAGRPAGKPSVEGRAASDADPGEGLGIDWRSGDSDPRKRLGIRRRILAMDGAELLRWHEDLVAQDLSGDLFAIYERMLLEELSAKAPRLLIERFSELHDDSQIERSGWLVHAFERWLGEDPSSAVAWLDARIAAGDLESRRMNGWSQTRLGLEAALLPRLIRSDPRAASARVAELPEDYRAWVLQHAMRSGYEPGMATAFVELIRARVPESSRGQAFSGVIDRMMWSDDGFDRVTGFLDEAGLLPAERSLVAECVAERRIMPLHEAGGVDRGVVLEVLDWLAQVVPGEGAEITGGALGWHLGTDFAERASLVEELHAERGNDGLLMGFLGGVQARKHPEASRRLAALIEDDERRAEVLNDLGGGR